MKLYLQALLTTAVAWAIQVPLRRPSEPLKVNPYWGSEYDIDAWDLHTPPDVDATGHLIFDTVGSLLQHWPNTRYRNGHNIVPGIVPSGTLLYHGRSDNKIPSIEWVATDPEHSMLFCRSECWHLTLVTTRPIKVLYFDGSSAAKMRGGPMDSQDIVLWGEILPERTNSERDRIFGLCEYGKKYGIDGYVRMEMDFEIMLCDFTAGVEVVSFHNLTSSDTERGRPRRGNHFEVIYSGSWHNFYPGETRIILDLSRLVSFYDVDLVPSLIEKRRGLGRWQHRLEGISKADVGAFMQRLDEVLRHEEPFPDAKRIDWATLIRLMTKRFSDRLELIRYILNNGTSDPNSDGELLDKAEKAQTQLRIMIGPYALSSVTPSSGTDISWASPIYRECAIAHTAYISREKETLAASERTLLAAVEDTNREICRVLTGMWAQGLLSGVDRSMKVPIATENYDIRSLLKQWNNTLEGLMEWLDWSTWVRCDPACSAEELCYLPTWPFFRPPPPRPGPGPGPKEGPHQRQVMWSSSGSYEEDWEIPKPRCIRRLEPYSPLNLP